MVNLPKIDPFKLKAVLSITAFFIVVTLVLVLTPKAISLSEAKLLASANTFTPKPQYLEDKVAGVAKKSVTQILDSKLPPPRFSAAAVLAEDLNTGQILYQKNMDVRLAPASTTKIMTALVASEYFKSGDTLIVPEGALVGGSNMGLILGERMTFRSLLYGMLLNSGNDAAYTIALNYPGGFNAFVNKMNAKVTELGLQNTHFDNPAGFDSPTNYSSAYDLVRIAREVTKNPILSRIVSTKETYVLSLDKVKSHNLKNLNQLLSDNGVLGIKTGFTEKAGENFVGLISRNEHPILTVVLNSQDRFGETKALYDWIYSDFTWIE